MRKYYYCIQCTDRRTGKIGCFFYNRTRRDNGMGFYAISPVFDSSIDLFKWSKIKGFESVESFEFYMLKD